MNPDPPAPLRPRDFALLLLASRDLLPRKRARDQQADRAGMDLKRRVLHELAAVDPEAVEMEAVLSRLAIALDVPSGPARAVCAIVYEEWQMACASPEWVAQLVAEAVATGEGPQRG